MASQGNGCLSYRNRNFGRNSGGRTVA